MKRKSIAVHRRMLLLAGMTLAAFVLVAAPAQQTARSRKRVQRPTAAAASDEISGPMVEAIRDNNLGVALMDQHNFQEAFALFQRACIMVPDSEVGCINSGIALLYMQQYEQARRVLTTASARDPQNPRVWLTLGLLERTQGNTYAATADFTKVAELDPTDAAAPKLSVSDGYGEQGKYSLAAELPPPDEVGAPIPVHFVDVTARSGLVLASRGAGAARRSRVKTKASSAQPSAIHTMADFLGSGACIFDYDGDGRSDIFLVDAEGRGDSALFRNLGRGRFADVTKIAKLTFRGGGMGCAVGDYDNDGRPDLAVSSKNGVRLFHNQGNGMFADVTAASGIHVDGLSLGLSFLDYNHDGRLDLYVTRFRDFPLESPKQPFAFGEDAAPGNMLWRNQGDGKFADATVDATRELAVGGDASSAGAIATDFTGNGPVDLLITGLRSVPEVLMNPRAGAFLPAVPWGAETQPPTAAGVAFDYDKDGAMDVALTHWAPTTLGLWRNVDGKSFEHVAIPDPGWMRAWGITALDYDNDGWIDLVAVGETFSGEGRIVLLRNQGGKGFHDVTHDTGLDKIALHDPRSVIAFDAQGTGALDLLITQNHRPPVLLESVGATQNNWTEIALHGDTENAMGLGARVEMISGALRQTWEMSGASGYLGQGPWVVQAGLGHARADAIRVRWPGGAIQVQRDLQLNQRTTIAQEKAVPVAPVP